ncbi:MAG TPA: FkbM family methyltransferase [Acidimicrobiia bacterium]|nr:FkbM family methyltransferase [Acidimicrobiia bacterium]
MKLQNLEAANARAEERRPYTKPGYTFRPVSVHDPVLHELKRAWPYYGWVEVQAHGGRSFLMWSANDDIVAAVYFWFGHDSFETLSLWIWNRLARRAHFVYDVGAYSGVFTLSAAQSNRDARIVAFEPVPRTYWRLIDNVRANRIGEQVEARNCALTDRDGTSPIFIYRGHGTLDAGASLHAKSHPAIAQFAVDVTRLDTYFLENPERSLDLVKIDAEDAEVAVVQGMIDSVYRHRPHMLVEVATGISLRSIVEILEPLGYHFAVIDDLSLSVGVDDVNGIDSGLRNVLFTPRPPSRIERFCERSRISGQRAVRSD